MQEENKESEEHNAHVNALAESVTAHSNVLMQNMHILKETVIDVGNELDLANLEIERLK